jgi:hypothetical protein
MFPPLNIARGARNYLFLGWIMSSPDGDGNVRAVVTEPGVVHPIGQIVAETVSDKSLCRCP